MVTTSEGPGPGVADTSGWYRVRVIRSDKMYYDVLSPAPGSTAYVEPRVLPEGTAEALRRAIPKSRCSARPARRRPLRSTSSTWTVRGSLRSRPQAAVLQAVVGPVQDQSVPTITDGAIQVWHVWHEIHYLGTVLRDLDL